MSNRMGVLSRRLGRYAGGFSFATVAFFAIGLYADSNTKGQIVFLFAGLVVVCLFASFFLWLAHGFAWAMIPEKPAEEKKPSEALKPAETTRPAEAMKPAEPMKAAESVKPAEAMKAAEPMKPAESLKPAEPTKPAEPVKPAEAKRPAEEKKPAEEKVIVLEEDPPDAKYTITGKRIY
jgi:cytoskeletal protein RodZ